MSRLSKRRFTSQTIAWVLSISLMFWMLALAVPFEVSAQDKEQKSEKSKKSEDENRNDENKGDEQKDKQKKQEEEDEDDEEDDEDEDEDEDEEDDDDEDEDEDEEDDDDKDDDEDDDDGEEDSDDEEDDDDDKDDDEDDEDDEDDGDEKEEGDKEGENGEGDEVATNGEAGQELAISKETVESVEPEAKQTTAVSASASTSTAMLAISATVETDPVPSAGDAADDPAIWINPADPSQSTIIGTNKRGGLGVYSLDGKQIQYLPDGMMNNVDLRTGFKLGDQPVALVTASNRSDNSIAIYRVNASTRMLENVASRKIVTVAAYGSCMYRSPSTGKFYYFVTAKSGDIEQWELIANGGGRVDALKVRGFKVGSQIEGCVVDDELGHLYVGEEMGSIWKYGAEPGAGTNRTEVDKAGAGRLVADIEGLAIAYEEGGKGYLIVSSQGNNSFAVYRREGNNEFVKSFKIVPGNGIDSVEETDGLDVTTANLGPAFPRGVIVVQDGINDKGYQNFKLVPFHLVIDKP